MSVADVAARLRAVGEPLADDDGVRWFNGLYLRVTERVDERLRAGDLFEDPRFVERLDEVFAERYLEAVRTGSGRAWEPLLRARRDARVHPGAFMLAGVNAHVNYDLPIALVDTRALLGGELERDTPRHRDFERIDELLAETERELHDRLGTGRLEEVVALWGVVRARDHAWDAAMSLHALGGDRSRRCELLRELAETVAGWGEALLRRGADAGR